MSLIERLEEYTSHPWIAIILGVAVALSLVSVLSQLFLPNKFVAGFFAVYATLTFGIAVFAYISSHVVRYVSLRQMKG
jgi:hypothetical protein